MIQIIGTKKIKVKVNKMKLNLKLLRRDLARVSLKGSSFGNDQPQEKLTPKKSRIKRALYGALVKSGAKIGDYADYTFKQILKVSIKYLGPIALSAILFRYRTNVYKLLVKQSDREIIDKKTAGLSKIATKANEKLGNINQAAEKINSLPFFTK
jgi:hypothetical protein